MNEPFLAIGAHELDGQPIVNAGDKITCRCGKRHILKAAKNEKGVLTEILLFYKCGKKAYLAAVDNRLLKTK